ncbi:hypothetical protein DRV85_09835 [Rhodosalinus halophilus]|uniref:Calx-beta domain-containing protein n=2 Tax=Rhodosalinus halophilus TaxID=2259333 RepID=A0A365U8T4_9RHOB|nr:hypothetical protein DRV85_09835 [Rhodosalinus halophilus]
MMRACPGRWISPAVTSALVASAPTAASTQVLTMEAVRTEAREGSGIGIELLLMLDQPAEAPFMAQVELTGVDATGGSDFAPPLIPVTFLENDVLKRAVIDIVDDPLDEIYRETFVASVGSVTMLDPQAVPGGIVNGAGAIPLTVIDDDNAFSVSARPGPEGGAVVLTLRQEHDSETTEVVVAAPGAGSATPGLDFEPWQKVARFPQGTTEVSLAIGLMPDDVPEQTESFPIEFAHIGTGTATFDPARVTGSIQDETEGEIPVRIEFTQGTVRMEVSGQTFTQPFQHAAMQGTLTRHIGGTRMTLSQGNGTDLTLRRFCAEDIDFTGIADGIPDLSAAEIGAGNRTGWRGEFVVDGIQFDYAMFEQPDGSYAGYGRQRGNVDGSSVLTRHGYRVIPLVEEDPEVARLPGETPEAQLPPEAVTDAVARQVAADLGMSAEAVRPYLSTSLGPDMTSGDGDSARTVEVEIWLDAEGRPLPADRAAPGPCDPGYGEARAAAKRLRYRIGTAGEAIIGQAVTQDVETGRLETAYMEDLGEASNSLDTAVERAHGGLSPALQAPD